jgi:RNA-splicing ligase RtcB
MDSKDKTREIGQLLEKYWNCETSLEEEQLLRSYFNGPDVPEQLKDAAELFRFFEAERIRSLEENFDSEVMRKVKTERTGKVVSMVRWAQVARIAAGVLVMVAATYFVRNEVIKSNPGTIPGEITDPQQALEETKKALMMISKSFGKAKEGAGKINMFNEAEQKISGKDKGEEKKPEPEKANI